MPAPGCGCPGFPRASLTPGRAMQGHSPAASCPQARRDPEGRVPPDGPPPSRRQAPLRVVAGRAAVRGSTRKPQMRAGSRGAMLARASSAVAFPAGPLLLALALAGCSGSPVPGAGDDLAVDGAAAPMLWTFGSPAPERAPYVRDYTGVANHPKDPASPDFFQGIPGGPAQGPFQTCCLFSWVEAPDLFGLGELSVLRVTLNWTNTQTD